MTLTPLLPASLVFRARVLRCVAALAAALLTCRVQAQVPRYTAVDLGDLGATTAEAHAISPSGIVVGLLTTTVNSQTTYQLFVHADGVISRLPTVPGFGYHRPTGMNASGTVVGWADVPNVRRQGFIITGGAATAIAGSGTADAINDAGTIAGLTPEGLPYVLPVGGTLTLLPTLPGATTTTVTAIDRAGNVIGFSRVTGGVDRAFTARTGNVTSLGVPSGGSASTNVKAWAVNAAGVIVGSTDAPRFSGDRIFEHAMMYANGVFSDRHGTGTFFPRSTATGIDASGTIVGVGLGSATVSSGQFFNVGLEGSPVILADTLNPGIPLLEDIGYRIPATGASYFGNTTGDFYIIAIRGINESGQIAAIGRNRNRNGNRAYRLDPIQGPVVAPAIAAEPQALTVAVGGNVTFSVRATGSPLSYEWRRNNVPIAGAAAASYTIAGVTAAQVGSYSVRVYNDAGSVTSAAATLAVGPLSTVARLANLSILTSLAGANDSFTMGYVVGGAGTSGTKPLIIRAVGPSLTPLGVPGALADPKLEIFAGTAKSGENDNWGGGFALQAAMDGVGAFALGGGTSRDAVIAANVALGDNSVKVTPVGNLSGAVIAEIYDGHPTAAFSAATPRLINVSVLKNIGTSLTAGFVIGGTGSRTVLIRAIGPSLAGFGVSGFVADPQLALFNSASAKIGENDNWGGTPALTAAFASVGAFALTPGTSRDAAILATLTPGNYTVQVSGVGGTTGVALVEVYEVP